MKKTMCAMWLLVGVLALGCSSKQKPPEDNPGGNGGGGTTEPAACVTSGCSGTLCVELGSEMVTTCEHKPEYDCYKAAVCERQADTSCGWTQTDELQTCIETARASAPAGAEDMPQ